MVVAIIVGIIVLSAVVSTGVSIAIAGNYMKRMCDDRKE